MHAAVSFAQPDCDQPVGFVGCAAAARLLLHADPLRKTLSVAAGNTAHDLARRPPAPHRCRRTFRRCRDRPVDGSDHAQDKTIGAFVCRADNCARASAGPLRGIAVGIKDIMDTADFPTEMGSLIYRGYRPRGDAAVVMMLKQAGASIVGKTTTTAFASTDPTATLNPHNHGHTPGGSSSGSAAAVGGRHDSAGAGDADRRLGDPAGVVLRRRRDQAVLSAAADGRRQMLFVDAGYGRPVRGRRRDVAHGLAAMTGRAELLPQASVPTPRIGVVTQDFAGAPEAAGGEALRIATKAAERAGASVRALDAAGDRRRSWRMHPMMQEFEAHQALAWEYRENYAAMAPNAARHGSTKAKAGRLPTMTRRCGSRAARGTR